MEWPGLAMGVLGGVGLFLLGMRLMSDGLRLAAGRALRQILERWTRTRLRAVLSGVLITSLVQSSSAVTVAVIGFANAGLLTLAQSVAVIYGSNVGTTVTGWLVALVGVQVDVKATALPAIGLGMALRLAGGSRRLGAFGEALAGLGLFFLGIDVLKSSLTGLQDRIPLDSFAFEGIGGVLLLTALGFALTVLMQSSSAAIAIVLTSVAGEIVPIEAGACLVIGANVGTTSTAAVAVLGATANARRVAMAHVAFNLLTGAVALSTLPLLLLVVARFREVLGMGGEPAAVVAAFHTLFNLLGVALMWPITERLVRILEQRFGGPEQEEGRPRYLDANVLSTPLLGLGALGLELARMGAMARETCQGALRRTATVGAIAGRRESLASLIVAMGDFLRALQRQRLPDEVGSALPTALRISRYYVESAELAQSIRASGDELEALDDELAARVRAFEALVEVLLDRTAVDRPETTVESAALALAAVQEDYAALKQALLRAGSEGRVGVSLLVAHLDRLSNVRRLAEQMERAARHFRGLQATLAGGDPTSQDHDEGAPAAPGSAAVAAPATPSQSLGSPPEPSASATRASATRASATRA